MFDYRKYYKEYNAAILEDYDGTIKRINEIIVETKNITNEKQKYAKFFNKVGKFILDITSHEKELNEDYFSSKSFEELLKINNRLYEDVNEGNYNTSYANPDYSVKVFGLEIGQILSALYYNIRSYINFSYEHRLFDIYRYNKLFIKFYDYIMNTDKVDSNVLKEYIEDESKSNMDFKTVVHLTSRFDPDISYIPELIQNTDFNDLRYLFKYGKYIGENEIEIAKYINQLSQDKIDLMANIYTEGYRKGFIRNNKDLSIKSTAGIIYQIGFERVMRCAINNLEKLNLKPVVDKARLYSTSPNKQLKYDHRFDNALFLNEAYTNIKEDAFIKVSEQLKSLLKDYAGPAVQEVFGEKPFSPESKKTCLKLSDVQTELQTKHQSNIQKEMNKYLSRKEYSFTIVAYPLPEIGNNFSEIFDEIIKVNTLDSDLYERIQQSIIDVLDKGEYVHVKGKGANKTDIMVKLQEIRDPNKETLFENCIADVNIPVGEVFTSPKLTGTNGVLHVEEVYLRDLKYENLEITFKDGYTEKYTCTNFDNEEDNQKYISENLMFPHKKLPLGEFAIGTNTTAYVMANKYNIVNLLPILIVEKMGPHFAIGDTCYSWSEDTPIYNPLNGKEIIARDNEKSILRKTNISEAYTQCHTDITLPYSGIESIACITKDKERIEIIKDGRFVLEGTSALNNAFEY